MSLNRLKPVDLASLVQWLKVNVQGLAQLPYVKAVRIFGSFARDVFHGESDVDLAIIVSDDSDLKKVREEIMQQWFERGAWPLDLVIILESEYLERRDYGGICVDILSDGVDLYPKWQWQPRS